MNILITVANDEPLVMIHEHDLWYSYVVLPQPQPKCGLCDGPLPKCGCPAEYLDEWYRRPDYTEKPIAVYPQNFSHFVDYTSVMGGGW